jgi:2-polyprenyl-3-methyl-5-hydroxy-6-metoxy-1,4-benzoquinol methylase
VALPDPGMSMSQDAEWCVVCENGKWRQIRFHDYHELYAVPGLYERIFYDILECDSPRTIRGLFQAELAGSGTSAEELRVLDLGAGNGMVAEELADMGAEFFVGVDIVEEAAQAAERDRPGLYDDYLIVDMADLEERTRRGLARHRFNAMTCVAALGFGDIPTDAFVTAYNLVRQGGWIAFNIKEDFLNRKDSSGFAELVHSMIDTGVMEVLRKERYRHRLGTARQPLHYVAFVGRKLKDLA